MIRGITPIDTALEMMGMHQSQAMTRYIFIETFVGQLVFALGFILSIGAGLDKGNFRAVIIFLLMFFSLWFLLVMPRMKSVDHVSAMERNGYEQVSTAVILRKNGYGEIMVNPVLDGVDRFMDLVVTGTVGVLDRASKEHKYLAKPFEFTKISLLTSAAIADGITDPELQEALVLFYQDHYWPTARGIKGPGLWPGHKNVVAAYREEGRSQWQVLKERLFQFLDHDRLFTQMFESFYNRKIDKDVIVRALIEHELHLKTDAYTFMSYASDHKRMPVRNNTLYHIQRLGQGTYQMIMQALPFLQGYALFLVLSAFPFLLGWTLLLRHMGSCQLFLELLLGVKSWTLIWAVLDKGSMAWFAVNQMLGGAEMWESPAVNGVIAVLAVILPIALILGIFLMFKKTTKGVV